MMCWCHSAIIQMEELEMPGLGYRFGMIQEQWWGIPARILRHGAICLGDRVCLAYHNKTAVMDHLGMPKAAWMNTSIYDV